MKCIFLMTKTLFWLVKKINFDSPTNVKIHDYQSKIIGRRSFLELDCLVEFEIMMVVTLKYSRILTWNVLETFLTK